MDNIFTKFFFIFWNQLPEEETKEQQESMIRKDRCIDTKGYLKYYFLFDVCFMTYVVFTQRVVSCVFCYDGVACVWNDVFCIFCFSSFNLIYRVRVGY